MTSDMTCDATVEYIIASEQHLDLAFRVEEAMPIVRKRLIEMVMKDVEKGFTKSEVISTGYFEEDVMGGHRSLIALRKHGWCEHDNKDQEKETGIHLSSHKDFSRPYIYLHLHGSYIGEKGEKDIVERFERFGNYEHPPDPADDRSLEDQLRGSIMWKYVPSEFGGWQSENFFKWAANSKKREEIVKRFIRMINDMAAEIDDTMKNLGRNA